MEVESSRPLPFWMFFISGLAIVIYSQFIILKMPDANKPAMTLFTYIGLGLFVIGVIKLLYSIISNKESKFSKKISGVDKIDNEEKKLLEKYADMYDNKPKSNVLNNNQINRVANNTVLQSNNSNTKMDFVYCSKCGQRCFKGDTFCSKCGNQLR
jgi:hypothetical protein